MFKTEIGKFIYKRIKIITKIPKAANTIRRDNNYRKILKKIEEPKENLMLNIKWHAAPD